MADAIIFRRRGSGDGGGGEYTPPNISGGTQSNTGNWWTAIFTSNGWFKAGQAKSNSYTVLVFGGGGCGFNWQTSYWVHTWANNAYTHAGWAGGGGGNMNKSTLTLTHNTNVSVTVGAGISWSSGDVYGGGSVSGGGQAGTSSFGTYLSATGGYSPKYYRVFNEIDWGTGYGGSCGGIYIPTGQNLWAATIATPWGCTEYALGTATWPNGATYGNNRSYGAGYGGGGGIWIYNGWYDPSGQRSGTGEVYTWFGGYYGGGGGIWYVSTPYPNAKSGVCIEYQRNTMNSQRMNTVFNSRTSISGSLGGAGSVKSTGTSGRSVTTSEKYANGTNLSGTGSGGSYGGGGGGYGGCGGWYGGGGGGYCANGGWYGGGGGGYGINGYGGNNGGGGGAYGRGGGPAGGALYGGGGWGYNSEKGANGVVIIQWYSN